MKLNSKIVNGDVAPSCASSYSKSPSTELVILTHKLEFEGVLAL